MKFTSIALVFISAISAKDGNINWSTWNRYDEPTEGNDNYRGLGEEKYVPFFTHAQKNASLS